MDKGIQPVGLLDRQRGVRADLQLTPSGYRSLSICYSHVGYGPMRLTSQSPFQSPRLGFLPRSPSTLSKRQAEVRLSGTWVNLWANGLEEGTYFLDYETLTSTVGLSVGLTNTLQLELEVEDRSRFGGSMDGFIQGFHDAVGQGQDGRDEQPKDQIAIRLAPDGGEPVVDLGPEATGPFARSVQLTLQHDVTCGTEKLPALSYAFTSRFGLGQDEFESRGNIDLGVSVAAARRWKRLYGCLTLGFARFNEDDFRGIQLKKTQGSALAAVEWRRWPRTSLVLQYLINEGAAEDFGPFSKGTNELSLGWKEEVVPGEVLEVGLIENLFTFENSPDFGLHVGFVQRF